MATLCIIFFNYSSFNLLYTYCAAYILLLYKLLKVSNMWQRFEYYNMSINYVYWWCFVLYIANMTEFGCMGKIIIAQFEKSRKISISTSIPI